MSKPRSITTPICKKKAFLSRNDAKSALRLIKRTCKRQEAPIPKFCYPCDKCGMWHLTKMDREKYQEIKQRK